MNGDRSSAHIVPSRYSRSERCVQSGCMPIIWWPSFTHLADDGARPVYSPKGQSGSAEAKMRGGREYEAVVRAVIAEKGNETVVTLEGNKVSGARTLDQPRETLQPGVVVRIVVESPATADRPLAGSAEEPHL